ncbi:hypothetical protein Hanom_Chr12g01137271 [Helianthus anomalus]
MPMVKKKKKNKFPSLLKKIIYQFVQHNYSASEMPLSPYKLLSQLAFCNQAPKLFSQETSQPISASNTSQSMHLKTSNQHLVAH